VGTPSWIAAGDFNRDGKLDFVSANTDGDSVSIFVGRGDATFEAPVEYDAGNLPSAVAAADVNGDHCLELVVGHAQALELSVLAGAADGAFYRPVNVQGLAGARSIAVADFNRGRPARPGNRQLL
jgi:hypothetical protein